MKRFLSLFMLTIMTLVGSFFFLPQHAHADGGGGQLNGTIWASSTSLAFSVSSITTGFGEVTVYEYGFTVVGNTQFFSDSNGNYSGTVPVAPNFAGTVLVDACTHLSVRVYDGQAGTFFVIPIPDCTQATTNPVNQKWIALGGPYSFLGYPTMNVNSTPNGPNGTGLYAHFQYGSIYWSSQSGAFEVHGSIRQEWANLGWERSFLGYPVTDETGTPDGVGRFNHFQYGSIYWTPQTGAHEVHGSIRQEWASLGWERSGLGYPTSDEQPGINGYARVSYFQHGYIAWSPSTGAVPFYY